MRVRHSVFVLFLMMAMTFGVIAFGDNDLIVTTDLLRIKQIQAVQFSPDGKTVAYVVKSIEAAGPESSDQKKDKSDEELPKQEKYSYRTQIYLVPVDGSSAPRQITFGDKGASSPVWSPNGRQIAFVRNVQDKPQIFILPLEGGEAWQLTSAKEGAADPRWSPNGNRILYDSGVPHHAVGKEITEKDNHLPEWPEERPGRKPGDVANWADKDVAKPKADPDGNLQEIREWLERNAVNSNPRVFDRLEIEGESDLQAELSYNHFYVIVTIPSGPPNGFPILRSCCPGRWIKRSIRTAFWIAICSP
jgi:dipeptidyl aminopeptidase/acylaminoacyl peptidase